MLRAQSCNRARQKMPAKARADLLPWAVRMLVPRMRLWFFILPVLLTGSAFAAVNVSALEALKFLPREQRKQVARIEGRDGELSPDRWHILVFDGASENGVREFVIADATVVATRAVSQFVESLSSEQVFGEAVKFDSIRAADVAQEFGRVNEVRIARIDYELRKDGAKGVPLWRLTCYDREGQQLGLLTLTATNGSVISHQGFERAPGRAASPTVRERQRTSGAARPDREIPRALPVATPIPEPRRRGLLDRFLPGRGRNQEP